MALYFSLLIAYLVGSIPSGYWFAKYLYRVDVREHGSGNIGATNVARVLKNKSFFFLIFCIDFAKAFGVLWLLTQGTFRYEAPMIAIAVLVGNSYSIFLGFSGGKGVATMLGILAYLFPIVALGFVAIWGVVLLFCRRVAIASVVGASLLVPAYIFFTPAVTYESLFFLLFVGIWVVIRHL